MEQDVTERDRNRVPLPSSSVLFCVTPLHRMSCFLGCRTNSFAPFRSFVNHEGTLPGHKAAGMRLGCYLAEWETAEWVVETNRQRGVAPTSRLVYATFFERLCKRRAARSGTAFPVKRTVMAQKIWTSRWRRRWGANLGRVQLADVDAPAVLQEKVKQRD